jgi:RNA polymerase sigma factor (sigma-70 family)
MGTQRMNRVVRQLCQAALRGDGAGLTDGQLLERFVAGRDEDAFAALVRRHGPMVLGVCRRIAGHAQDAEDAFQAAFLVLARRADSVVPPDRVGNWLHGVACQTARKARATAARRRRWERQVTPMPEPEAPRAELWDDLRPLLDREVGGLPDKYRAPVILCDLEGRTRKEAARQLGWSEGTLSGRLSRARALLARRLARRGLTLPAGLLGAVLAENKVAAVPAALAAAARGAVAAGTGLAAGGAVSARAVALAEGVLKTMVLSKSGLAVVLVLVVALAGLATRTVSGPLLAGDPAEPPKPAKAGGKAAAEPGELRKTLETVPWVLMKVDAARNTISVRMLTQAHCLMGDDLFFHHLDQITTWRNVQLPLTPAGSRLGVDDLPVARGAKVLIEGKEGGLGALKEGMYLTLKLAAGEPAVARIDVRSMHTGEDVVLKASDADAKTITVTFGGKDLTLAMAADAQIVTNTAPVGKAEFKDLQPGMRLLLTLGVDRDRIAVKRILARKDLE